MAGHSRRLSSRTLVAIAHLNDLEVLWAPRLAPLSLGEGATTLSGISGNYLRAVVLNSRYERLTEWLICILASYQSDEAVRIDIVAGGSVILTLNFTPFNGIPFGEKGIA